MHRLGIPFHAPFPERAYRDIADAFHIHTGYPIRSVLDIGANFGQCSLFLADRLGLPTTAVTCVEAHPVLARLLAERTGFSVIAAAVSSEPGPRVFNARHVDERRGSLVDLLRDRVGSTDRSGMSSLLTHGHDHNQDLDPVEVPSLLLGPFLQEHDLSFDFAKIDVEGAALEALHSLGSQIDRIASIHIEAETLPIWDGQALWDEVRAHLESHGFELVLYRLDRHFLQCESYWIRSSRIRSFASPAGPDMGAEQPG